MHQVTLDRSAACALDVVTIGTAAPSKLVALACVGTADEERRITAGADDGPHRGLNAAAQERDERHHQEARQETLATRLRDAATVICHFP